MEICCVCLQDCPVYCMLRRNSYCTECILPHREELAKKPSTCNSCLATGADYCDFPHCEQGACSTCIYCAKHSTVCYLCKDESKETEKCSQCYEQLCSACALKKNVQFIEAPGYFGDYDPEVKICLTCEYAQRK